MKHLLLLTVGVILFLPACHTAQEPGAGAEYAPAATNSLSLPYELPLDRSQWVHPVEVRVPFDPFFKSAWEFRAYSLQEVLHPVLRQLPDTQGIQLVFVCTDGYEAHMSLSDALSHQGFIAYQEAGRAEGSGWSAKTRTTLQPFYLVWTDEGAAENPRLSWPYALTRIRFSRREAAFAAALPAEDSLLPGFALFRDHCIKCHSVNKAGGQLGPELNVPRNITTYREKEQLWGFIQKPQSYRYNSKMPPQTQIDRDEFELIYAYLRGMSQ